MVYVCLDGEVRLEVAFDCVGKSVAAFPIEASNVTLRVKKEYIQQKIEDILSEIE